MVALPALLQQEEREEIQLLWRIVHNHRSFAQGAQNHGLREARQPPSDEATPPWRHYYLHDLVHSKKRKATAEGDVLDQATLRELYCRYTVACSLPFAHVEQPAFRDFIRYLRPAADDLLPRSANTVKADLQWGYDNKKEFVKRALQNALSSVHIVPDNWTSPNCLGVIGFTVQFVTEDHGLQSLVVRIKELEGQHSGENMEFIREYGIASKVGYFMMDNASNMNTMIDKVFDDLEHEFDVFYDPLPHRLRCFGHIINMSVMEFLIGKRPPTTDSYRGPSDEEVEQWRKRGAIGKLHNIVVYITWSPQRLQAFTILSDGLRLRRDNDTRWNSWYKMVEWALRFKVRQAITIFCAQEPTGYPDSFRLGNFDRDLQISRAVSRCHNGQRSPILRQSGEPETTTRRPNGYKIWMKEQKATILNMDDDEYEVYCREPVMMISDPLKWWLELAQRRRFPNLSLMAIDILSIPPMSAETERLFSKARLTVTDQRGSMNIETLNLLECLRPWDRSALIAQSEHGYVAPAATDAMPDV
ncbi:hypothetical protein LZL87_013720 [Fusarium oxysporum]|nr:hypothetical protein LZL87_013720 [Fusarium oxysporum]